ncbi:hypothetical protein NB706_002457 [Xanthomonas sacchari]|nr:hypothetical protein [Xanthomonas sacchari]
MPTTRAPTGPVYTVLPSAFCPGNIFSAVARLRMIAVPFSWIRLSVCAASRSMYSSGAKSRPATSFRPRVFSVPSSAMYCAALRVGRSWSALNDRLVFQE